MASAVARVLSRGLHPAAGRLLVPGVSRLSTAAQVQWRPSESPWSHLRVLPHASDGFKDAITAGLMVFGAVASTKTALMATDEDAAMVRHL